MSDLDLTPIKDRLARTRHLPIFLTEGDIAKARENRKSLYRWHLEGTWDDAVLFGRARDDIAALVAEVERLRERQESHDLANEAIRWERAALDAKEAHDALHAQLDAVRELHRKMPVYDILMEDCHEHDPETHGFEAMVGEWYCDQHISFYTCSECYSDFVDKDYLPVYPCPTIRALEGEQG